MRSLGIDLASQAATTAACVIDWGSGRGDVRWIRTGLDDIALLNLVREATVSGIDAPFGWPLPFTDFVARHEAGNPRTPIERWTPEWRDRLRFRQTDVHVKTILERWPLSVSSDLIAIVAYRCAGLLDQLGVTDRSGEGSVVEVYPALALARWGLPSRGYKGPGGDAIRSKLLETVQRTCPALAFGDSEMALCRRSDHALDALIAALVARAAFLHLTDTPSFEQRTAARTEGWIVVPRIGSLGRLASQ